MPVLEPIGLSTDKALIEKPAFYLSSGIDDQLEKLWRFAQTQPVNNTAQSLPLIVVGRTINSQLTEFNSQAALLLEDENVPAIRAAQAIIFIGTSPELSQLKRLILDTTPLYLTSFNALDAQTIKHAKLYLSLPRSTPRVNSTVERQRQAFAAHQGIDNALLSRHVWDTSKLFATLLKQSGHKLTRKKWIKKIETLYRYQSDFSDQLTFRHNKHIGSNKNALVRYSPQSQRWQFVKTL